MKIAILGATGWIGSHITAEAKKRNHQLVILARDPKKVIDTDAEVREFDLTKNTNLTELISDVDAVIAAIGGRAEGNHHIVAETAEQLLSAVEQTEHKRLLWVGGAGSLEIAPGKTLVSSPDFPAEYKAEALAQGEALAVFRQTKKAVNWTFVSPAAIIYPGDSEKAYRIGGDQFFTDETGKSQISVTDYAIAMLDETEANKHPKQRISLAY